MMVMVGYCNDGLIVVNVAVVIRYVCCWLCRAIGCDGGILVVVVMVTTVVRVALLIKSN